MTNINITLTAQQAMETVSYLQSLSDRLTRQHADSHSGVDQFMLLSAIQGVDRIYQEIREQVEAQTVSHEAVTTTTI